MCIIIYNLVLILRITYYRCMHVEVKVKINYNMAVRHNNINDFINKK